MSDGCWRDDGHRHLSYKYHINSFCESENSHLKFIFASSRFVKKRKKKSKFDYAGFASH